MNSLRLCRHAIQSALIYNCLIVCNLFIAQEHPAVTPRKIDIYKQEIKVPMEAAGDAGLQTFLITPSTAGKHPLVIMTHGTSSGKSPNQDIGPGSLQPEAIWFAKRGWSVFIVIRRGYGLSGGKMDRNVLNCSESGFESLASSDTADLQAVYDYASKRADIDIDRVIAVGVSTGGYAVISFGAHAPAGLKAVLNFSGGWHGPFGLCTKTALYSAFHVLGESSHIPTLWLYAKNDELFGPKFVQQIHEAYTSSGGIADLQVFKSSGDNGHYLFSESPELWGPAVERFLAEHQLPSVELDDTPKQPLIKLPPGFSEQAQKAFEKFQKLGPYKAFAVGPNGRWAYSSGKRTAKLADQDAVDTCGPTECVIIATDKR